MPRDADLAACRARLRTGSRTFSAAANLLPRRVRDPATVLYAFCRVADDAVDADPTATTATVEALGRRLDRIYAGRPEPDPVDRALARMIDERRMPRAVLDALLEGLLWDAEGRRYETLDDLYAYAARVAGAVGAGMALLMGVRSAAVLARACELGVAMQLTNVARDVGEDAARGRVYLPLSWLREAGVNPDAWLAEPRANEAVAGVVERLLDAATALYTRADEGIAALPRDCRTAIRAARLVYAEIGRVVARARFDSVTRRAVVPSWRKAWLVLRAVAGARSRSSRREPPLEPTRFLIVACAESS